MPNMKAVRQNAENLLEKAQLSDAAAVAAMRSRDQKIAEKRRTYAIAREKRIESEQSRLPAEMEAREGVLMPNYIKHSHQDMIVKIPLDNSRIKIIAFDNYEHIGNAFHALSAILSVREGREKVETLLDEMDKEFTRSVVKPILKQQQYAVAQFKKLGEAVEGDLNTAIKRAGKPIIFDFRSRNPRTSKWLNWCAQADSASVLLLRLTHYGIITERDYYDRVTAMVNVLNQYASFVYQARQSAFRSLNRAAARNEQSRKELEQVKQDLHDNEALELHEDGELSQVEEPAAQPETAAASADDSGASDSNADEAAAETSANAESANTDTDKAADKTTDNTAETTDNTATEKSEA